MNILIRWCALLILQFFAVTVAAEDVINIGYQTGIEPAKLAIANAEYEKLTNSKINWRRFDNGAEVVRAIASGDIDIGNVGSSVVATAVTRRLPIETFLIAAQLGESEALIVRNNAGINSPQDLIGKTIAVPFVSTSHYSLLTALKHWNVDQSKVKVINLRASEIAAAWQRGDIDAAFVWEPSLGRIKETGKVLATSNDLAQWGAPSFDLWISRKDFAQKQAKFLADFARVSIENYQHFRNDPKQFVADANKINQIAKVTGAKPDDIQTLLLGDFYPVQNEQINLLSVAVSKALLDTATFLKSQGQLDSVLSDYSAYVNPEYVRQTSK